VISSAGHEAAKVVNQATANIAEQNPDAYVLDGELPCIV